MQQCLRFDSQVRCSSECIAKDAAAADADAADDDDDDDDDNNTVTDTWPMSRYRVYVQGLLKDVILLAGSDVSRYVCPSRRPSLPPEFIYTRTLRYVTSR